MAQVPASSSEVYSPTVVPRRVLPIAIIGQPSPISAPMACRISTPHTAATVSAMSIQAWTKPIAPPSYEEATRGKTQPSPEQPPTSSSPPAPISQNEPAPSPATRATTPLPPVEAQAVADSQSTYQRTPSVSHPRTPPPTSNTTTPYSPSTPPVAR